MCFGADYYPEHWPRERWETEAEMMAAANINLVCMGDLSGRCWNPERECSTLPGWMKLLPC